MIDKDIFPLKGLPYFFNEVKDMTINKKELLKKEIEGNKAVIKILEGQNKEYVQKIIKLQRELDVTDLLLDQRQKVLDAIPECEIHGSCIPHAMEWIERIKSIDSKVDKKYVLLHESNAPIVTLLRIKEKTCIIQFSHGELKEVSIELLGTEIKQ